MELESCLHLINNSSSSTLWRPKGLPELPTGLSLPPDLARFYELAGGASLFVDQEYSIEIVDPRRFALANPIIRGELGEYDISYDWFIIAQSEPQYISIDLHPDRLGRCYDSFWDRHAMRGYCPVLSRSFTELLANLVEAEGKQLFWLSQEFDSLGDAYDDV